MVLFGMTDNSQSLSFDNGAPPPTLLRLQYRNCAREIGVGVYALLWAISWAHFV